MSVIKTVPISLRAFGYSMKSSNETRCIALQKAVDAHGVEKDDDCDDPTPEPTVPVDDRNIDRFIDRFIDRLYAKQLSRRTLR
eukprot:gene11808-30_t